MPRSYTEVCHVGSGRSGSVSMQLPDATITTSQRMLARGNNEDEAINCAASRLVAVKQCTHSQEIANERNILRDIRRQATEQNNGAHIVQVLNWDRGSKVPKWLILSTIPVCCDLETLAQHDKPNVRLPYQMTWLIFIQMYRALHFLQNVCNPPIYHRDLVEKNVLIGFVDVGYHGLPHVMLIDFGTSRTVRPGDYKKDTLTFTDIIAALAYRTEDDEGTGCEMLDEFLQTYNCPRFCDLEEVWLEFGGAAKDCMKGLTPEVRTEIRETVREAVEGEYGDVRGAVRRIVVGGQEDDRAEDGHFDV